MSTAQKGQQPVSAVSFDPNLGNFDVMNTEHLSFYKADYLAARSALQLPYCHKEENLLGRNQMRGLPREAFNLHQLFRAATAVPQLQVLRAPDPSLRQRYRRVECLDTWPLEVQGCTYIYE